MIRDAVTCDRPDCLAVMLEPLECQISFEPCEGCEYCEHPLEGHMAWYGWISDETGHTCPACNAGRGPVLERGECPGCGGITSTTADSDRCRYCRHIQPHRDPSRNPSGSKRAAPDAQTTATGETAASKKGRARSYSVETASPTGQRGSEEGPDPLEGYDIPDLP